MKKKFGVILTAMMFVTLCFVLSACVFNHTHTPNVDNDGDCTTPVECSTCHAVMPAKSHVADTNWGYDNLSHYTVCTNENCTIVLDEKTNHILPNGANGCECGYVADATIFRIRDGYLSYCNPREYTSITIPKGVIRVGEQAFRDCKNITSVTIPSSVKIISYQAFYNCIALTNIMIPSSVIRIGEQAFSGCTSLASITIPKEATSIDLTAFSHCTNLASITVEEGNTKYHSAGNSIIETATKTLFLGCKNSSIPTDGSVTAIGDKAFEYCTSLASITIPEGVTIIGNYAFSNCTSLERITLPESVISIYNYAFSNCTSLASITIPASVTSIYNYAFSNCTSLASITIPEGVTRIGSSAFANCSSLASITLSESVTSIGDRAFEYCTSLASITIPEGVKYINSSAFANCSSLASITIPKSVTRIGDRAFEYCTSLASITLPESVTYIDWWAFFECNGLTIYAEASAKPSEWQDDWNRSNCPIVWDYKNNEVAENGSIYYIAENGIRYALKNDVATVVGQSTRLSGAIEIPSTVLYKSNSYNVRRISNKAFYSCTSITSITIPDSVTSIGDKAFEYCTSLASITIPDSVTAIGERAFYSCTSLASITIHDSVTAIGDSAFYGCSGLTIYAEARAKPSGWVNGWNYTGCPIVWDYKNNEIANDGNIYYIAENGIRYALKDNVATVVGQSTRLSGAIDIPSTITYKNNRYSVTSISNKAFYSCTSITSITIPDSVTAIGESAFYYCRELTSITYTGATAAWNAITKGAYWNGFADNYTITCTDGTLTM